MQHQYFLADLHLGHGDGVLRFRPQFSTWQEHDEFIVNSINEIVNPNDSLYLAGDIIITDKGIHAINQINCRNIYLIPGNHDGERSFINLIRYKRVMGAMQLTLGGKLGVITHIPVHPSCLDERWAFNIHGHLHDQSLIDKRYLCISCEQTKYRPVTKVWLEQKLKLGK